jgi:hypothetical protein
LHFEKEKKMRDAERGPNFIIAMKYLVYLFMNESEPMDPDDIEELAREHAPRINSVRIREIESEVSVLELQELGMGIISGKINHLTAGGVDLRLSYAWLKSLLFVEELPLSTATRARFEGVAQKINVSKKEMFAFGRFIFRQMADDLLPEPPETEPPQPRKSPAKQNPPPKRKRKAA